MLHVSDINWSYNRLNEIKLLPLKKKKTAAPPDGYFMLKNVVNVACVVWNIVSRK